MFITEIFHPNISENGYVSHDLFANNWSPSVSSFDKIIYQVQSLIDSPNLDVFLNEKAAKLYKEDIHAYNKIVQKDTYLFANYSNFQEEIINLNLKMKTVKKGQKIK